MTATDLSILIADDHPLYRGALQQVISQLFPGATLHEAANVAKLQQQAEQHKPSDLLLLDLHMPGALGYSALSWVTGQYPQTRGSEDDTRAWMPPAQVPVCSPWMPLRPWPPSPRNSSGWPPCWWRDC